ncbi:MAG: TonB family protein [Pseudomonadota bacterium]
MWTRTYSLLALICFAALPEHASAAPLELEPSTEWKLREYEDKCRVSRVLGTGEDRVSLWIDQGSTSAAYNLTLIGRPLRNPYGSNLTVQFAPEPEYSRAYLRAKSSKGRPVISLFGARLIPTRAEIRDDKAARDESDNTADEGAEETVDLPEAASAMIEAPIPTPEQVAAVTELRLGRALRQKLVLKTGSMTAPLADLDACARKVIAAFQARTAKAAYPVDTARWTGIISRNYPTHMLLAEQEGQITVSLTIGTNGRVSNCEVTQVKGPTSFNDTVCMLMFKHATFEPARDAEGEPIPGMFSTSVIFRLN